MRRIGETGLKANSRYRAHPGGRRGQGTAWARLDEQRGADSAVAHRVGDARGAGEAAADQVDRGVDRLHLGTGQGGDQAPARRSESEPLRDCGAERYRTGRLAGPPAASYSDRRDLVRIGPAASAKQELCAQVSDLHDLSLTEHAGPGEPG